MRIVFAGTPDAAVPTLRALVAGGHEVVGAITREDAPVGRKRVLTASAVGQAAEDLGIETLKTNRLDDDATGWVREKKPDLGVIVAYGGLVRTELLETPVHGWVNLHFSELPKWRGAAPVQRALIAGETRLGISVFQLVEALDAGDVFASDRVEIGRGVTAGEALDVLAEHGADLVTRVADGIATGSAQKVPQEGESTYAHKLERVDGRLSFSQTQESVLAHWAGVTPAPGAWAELDGQPVKLHELKETAESATDLAAGTAILRDNTVLLGTATEALEITVVQPAGKPRMAASDWLRGRGGQVVFE